LNTFTYLTPDGQLACIFAHTRYEYCRYVSRQATMNAGGCISITLIILAGLPLYLPSN